MNSGRFARLGVLVAVLGATLALSQQRKPFLQIDSPADRTVVNPGQTITVSVSSPGGVSFKVLGVHGELGTSGVAHSVPARFSITIPSGMRACRRYMLTADGVTTTGESVESDGYQHRRGTTRYTSFYFLLPVSQSDPGAQRSNVSLDNYGDFLR